MAALPVIQSLWIGGALSCLEQLCAKSFMDHGHEFHLYAYDRVDNVPDGAVVKDGNEILPADKIFRYRGGSYAGFSNWFRYALLAKRGEFWVDMDIICIKPFAFDEDIILSAGGAGLYTTSVICFPPGHPFMRAMERVCREYKGREGARFGAVGGLHPLTKMIVRHNMQRYVKPYTCFVPIPDSVWVSAFDNTFADGLGLFSNTHGVHLSNEMGRRIGLDKNAQFDADSLVEQLKRKHNIAPVPGAGRITSAELTALVIDKRIKEFDRRELRKRRKSRAKKIAAGLLAVSLGVLAYLWLSP